MTKQPHLPVKEGDVNDITLISGDPERVDHIVKQCENVERVT